MCDGQTKNMKRKSIDYDDLLEYTLELGKCMLQCGAEVRRVEDTIIRVVRAYGAEYSEVFSVTAFVLVTVKWENGHKSTQTKRVKEFETNLQKLEEYNELARYICRETPEVEEIREILKELSQNRKRDWIDAIGYCLSAGVLTVFFGGSVWDAFAAGLVGLFVFFFDRFLTSPGANRLVYTAFACMVSGWFAILLVDVGFGNNLDAIMIGCIMLFIPTLALCNSLKDVLHGDILTGIYRSVEAVLIAAAIAVGIFIANLTLGGIRGGVPHEQSVSVPVQIVTAVLCGVGLSIYFHIHRKKIWTAALGGGISWVIYLIIFAATQNDFFSNAVAAFAICLYSEIMARLIKAPANIFLIPAVVPLLPGNYFYHAVAGLINGDMTMFVSYGESTLAVVFGLEIGLMIAFILYTKLLKMKIHL